jgi:hypothetical protein
LPDPPEFADPASPNASETPYYRLISSRVVPASFRLVRLWMARGGVSSKGIELVVLRAPG